MSDEKTAGRSFFVKATLALTGMVGVWLLGAWLTSSPSIHASDALPQVTFQSPIPPIGAPQLSLVKTADNDTPIADEEVVYTLTYSTTRPGSQAFNVKLYDLLPAGAQYLSSDPAASYQDGMLLFTAPSIGTTNATATVRVRVREGYEQLRNHALVMADLVPPAHASLVTGIEQPLTQLHLNKTGYAAVLTNSVLVYTLQCENVGDEKADDVTVVDVLPAGLSLVGASPPPDEETPPVLSWSLGELGAGESQTIVLSTTTPASTGVITNVALADARQSVVTRTVFATRIISEGAILHLTKQGSAPAVELGDELVYTLRYENIGNQAATEVELVDTLPSDVTVTGVYPAPTPPTSQQVTWELETLNPGESGEAVITTTVGGSGGATLHNVADITGPGSVSGHAELDTPVRQKLLYLPIVTRNW